MGSRCNKREIAKNADVNKENIPLAVSSAMDSQFQVDGRLLEIVDDTWKKEKLPEEDIAVPIAELPDPEADNGAQGESMKEQESKWTDLGLNQLAESTNANASS